MVGGFGDSAGVAGAGEGVLPVEALEDAVRRLVAGAVVIRYWIPTLGFDDIRR